MAYEKVFATKAYIAKEIAGGELTLDDWGICYYVDGQGSANDELDTITGGIEGQILVIKADGVTITLKHGTGNIALAGGADFLLSAEEQFFLIYDGANWLDIQTSGVGDFITKALMDADSVLTATNDNTPVATALTEQTVLGMLTGGHPAAIPIGITDDDIVQIDGADIADNEYARFTANGLESRTASEVYTDLLGQVMLENDSIKLDAGLSVDGKWNGITQTGIAGETMAFGQVIYQAVGDTQWKLAKADAAATSQGRLGICLLAADDEEATNVLLWGQVRADTAFPDFTAYAPVFISSATAGDLSSSVPAKSTGHIIRCVGQAITKDELEFHPSPDWFEYA